MTARGPRHRRILLAMVLNLSWMLLWVPARTNAGPYAERLSWPEGKFGDFAFAVCRVCAVREHDCGCERGMANPPVALLHAYYLQYLHWSSVWSEAAEQEREREEMDFVVAGVYGGGLGNQLQQAVQGLVVALRTGRPLVIDAVHSEEEAHSVGMSWHPYLAQTYAFDSVLPLLPISVPLALGFAERGSAPPSPDDNDDGFAAGPPTKLVHLHSTDGVEFMTCGNWQQEVEGFKFVKVWALAEAHLALVNPHEGPELQEAFGDRLFFWLSHFLWNAASASFLDDPVVLPRVLMT